MINVTICLQGDIGKQSEIRIRIRRRRLTEKHLFHDDRGPKRSQRTSYYTTCSRYEAHYSATNCGQDRRYESLILD